MTSRTKKRVLFIALALAAFIAVALTMGWPEKGERAGGNTVTYSLFETDNGWGYDILVGERIVIHQPFVPVIPGEQGFPDSLSVTVAARLVIEKLKNDQSPSLTKEDIEKILAQ